MSPVVGEGGLDSDITSFRFYWVDMNPVDMKNYMDFSVAHKKQQQQQYLSFYNTREVSL